VGSLSTSAIQPKRKIGRCILNGSTTAVPDYDFILPRLATGGALTGPADVEAMVDAGITHVIDCTTDEADQNADDVRQFVNNPAIICLWNPTIDDGTIKEPAWFDQSIWFALGALTQPHVRVYAHCTNGQNRGPSTAFAIMLAMGWDYNSAIDLIHTARPVTVGGIIYAGDAANAVKALGYL
jgi:hypothetical protein